MVLSLETFPVDLMLLVYVLDLEGPEVLWVVALVDLFLLIPWPTTLEKPTVVEKRIGYAITGKYITMFSHKK